jgi:hypothetical protein
MSGPIVFVSRWRVVSGRRDAWVNAYTAANTAIGAAKPRTALFAAYLNADDSETRILHVFPDAAAVEQHFAGSDDRTSSVADLIIPAGYELYGPAPTSAVDQLSREAAASRVDLEVFPTLVAGYMRSPAGP